MTRLNDACTNVRVSHITEGGIYSSCTYMYMLSVLITLIKYIWGKGEPGICQQPRSYELYFFKLVLCLTTTSPLVAEAMRQLLSSDRLIQRIL